MTYPKQIIKCIDELFPKGDKRRGDALVLQAVAYVEGKEIGLQTDIKKDRIEINKIIKNCLPLIKLNKAMIQECADAILLYFIEKTSTANQNALVISPNSSLYEMWNNSIDDKIWDETANKPKAKQ